MENQSEGTKALALAEHSRDANAKRIIIRAQDPATGSFANIGAVDNGDGTFGIRSGDPSLVTRLDDSADPIIYVGKAPIGSATSASVWQIARLDTSSGLIKTWAGNAGFTQIWDNKASLSYS